MCVSCFVDGVRPSDGINFSIAGTYFSLYAVITSLRLKYKQIARSLSDVKNMVENGFGHGFATKHFSPLSGQNIEK